VGGKLKGFLLGKGYKWRGEKNLDLGPRFFREELGVGGEGCQSGRGTGGEPEISS